MGHQFNPGVGSIESGLYAKYITLACTGCNRETIPKPKTGTSRQLELKKTANSVAVTHFTGDK